MLSLTKIIALAYKICHFSTVHPSTDPRIFVKMCSSLAANNWTVDLIIQHEKNEAINGVNIIALPKPKSRLSRMFSLAFKAFRYCLKSKADVYHFHDPELLPVGVWLAIFGKRVVYDVHEDYPKQILDKAWLGPRWMRKIIAGGMKFTEWFSILFFKAVVCATEDIANRFNPKKAMVVYNYASLAIMDKVEAADYQKPSDKKIVFYAGGLTEIRGIGDCIDMVAEVDDVELWLFGKWESDAFLKKCEEKEGWKKTKNFGYMPMDEMFRYLRLADIGVLLIHPLPRYLVSLPTKIFEYLAYEKPVLMTHSQFWGGIFGETVQFCQPELTDQINQLKFILANPDRAAGMAKQGRKLIENSYCWEFEVSKLEDCYRKMITK